ncbi:MAG: hypothetical protein GKR93_15210 [Gammaproteobacteria bacterium]|nr:hypothetical protein [Gammaproteobacteria bacterium]
MSSNNQTVIKTKITPPVNRLALVYRNRLVKQIVEDKQAKLILVAAPAGFGKTTLITQLFEKMSSDWSCCWYSLDRTDNDPVRFLLHFIASIRTVDDDFGKRILQLIETTLIADISDTLAYLINDLVDTKKDICLYIDDYHFSDSEQINQFIELFINLAPLNFRLFISSRLRPKLSLSALKVHGHLIEVTASQLRFDTHEAKLFMNDIQSLSLSDKQLDNLIEHSEGWIAGLQLASLSLRDIERRDEFIDSFSGNLRDIAEYLAADVLNQQTAEVRDFLLRTAVLERMNAEVCNALTKMTESQVLLSKLEEQNLFVIPLDRDRQWYRYHHLFHEFLLGQLRKTYPEDIVSLYSRAANWFETAGYALLSGNMDKAVNLVESQVENEMKAGRMPRVNNWVDRIPDRVCLSHSKLLFAKCTALYHMNRALEAEETLELMRKCKDVNKSELQESVLRIEAGIAICRDDIDRILPPLSSIGMVSSNFDNGTVCNDRGYALASAGDFKAATEALQDARYYHGLNGSTFGVVYADCFLGFIDLAQAKLHKCYERFTSYLNEANKTLDTYVAPVPSIMHGIVFYEWGDLDKSYQLLLPSLPVIEKVGHIKLLSLGYMTLAKIYGSRGDHANAMRFFDRVYQLSERRGAPYSRLQALIESERIRYLIRHAHINEAIDIAESLGIDIDQLPAEHTEPWNRVNSLNLLSWARLQIAAGSAEKSLTVLEQLENSAARAERTKRVIECKILRAMAFEKLARRIEAQELLLETICLSHSNGLVKAFTDDNIGDLLSDLNISMLSRDSSDIQGFLQKIQSASQSERKKETLSTQTESTGNSLDTLNEREIDILKLIAEGQSNTVVAEQLSISENTVKWHVKNIFAKLNVNKRAVAVVVAQQMNLLD